MKYEGAPWPQRVDAHATSPPANSLLTMLKTAITRMRAVVIMVRTNRSQGLLVTMMREDVGNQLREQKDPFLPCWGRKETGGKGTDESGKERANIQIMVKPFIVPHTWSWSFSCVVRHVTPMKIKTVITPFIIVILVAQGSAVDLTTRFWKCFLFDECLFSYI